MVPYSFWFKSSFTTVHPIFRKEVQKGGSERRTKKRVICYLKRDDSVVDDEFLREEVRSDCRLVLIREPATHVLVHQRRFADPITNTMILALGPYTMVRSVFHI